MHIGIIGAGISGLSAAYAIEQHQISHRGWTIDLFDAASSVGGVINTVFWEETAVELGPDSLVDKERGVVDLARRLGLGSQLRTVKTGSLPPLWLKADGWHDFPSQEVRSYTLLDGVGQLPQALQRYFRTTRVHTGHPVLSVKEVAGNWFFHTPYGTQGPYGAVILAVPTPEVARMLGILPMPMPWLNQVYYHPRAVVAAAYPENGLGSHEILQHTGFVVSPQTGLGLTACTWLNVKWPYNRTSDVLARTFWGPPGTSPRGWTDPMLIQAHEEALTKIVAPHLPARWTRVMWYETALPTVSRSLQTQPRRLMNDGRPYLAVLGPYLDGPGLSDCVRLAWEEANALVNWAKTTALV